MIGWPLRQVMQRAAWVPALLFAGCQRAAVEREAVVGRYAFEEALTDSGPGGCHLEAVGAVPFTSTPNPAEGRWMAGPFDDARYPTGGACLLAAMQGLPRWTITGFFYLETFTSDQGLAEIYTDSRHTFLVQVLNNGSLRIAINAVDTADSPGGVVTPGVLYGFGLTGEPEALTGWVFPADQPANRTVVTMAADARLNQPIRSVNFGRLAVAPGRILNGYLDDITILNAARR